MTKLQQFPLIPIFNYAKNIKHAYDDIHLCIFVPKIIKSRGKFCKVVVKNGAILMAHSVQMATAGELNVLATSAKYENGGAKTRRFQQ